MFELLVAMVILTILAAISLKLVNARRQAYLAVIKSDLRALATAQEAYYFDSFKDPGGPRYAPNTQQLDFNRSPNVLVQMVGIKEGWSARTVHLKRNDFRCAMYVGNVRGLIMIYEPAIEEGAMECEPKTGRAKGQDP